MPSDRAQRLIDLTRRELSAMGDGDPHIGRLGLHPGLIAKAISDHPDLSIEDIYVMRPRTTAVLLEAKRLREKPWAQQSEDERIITLAIKDACHGTDSAGQYVMRTENGG